MSPLLLSKRRACNDTHMSIAGQHPASTHPCLHCWSTTNRHTHTHPCFRCRLASNLANAHPCFRCWPAPSQHTPMSPSPLSTHEKIPGVMPQNGFPYKGSKAAGLLPYQFIMAELSGCTVFSTACWPKRPAPDRA